jgi:hypothetical protein
VYYMYAVIEVGRSDAAEWDGNSYINSSTNNGAQRRAQKK